MQDPLFRRIRLHAKNRLETEEVLERKDRLPRYKRFLQLEDEMLRRYHAKGDSGLQVTAARSVLFDVIVENLYSEALRIYRARHGEPPCQVAVLATGGYGRGELNPHSDIDLLFLYPNRARGEREHKLKEVISEEILYILWDLRLKVGHATRTIKEAIQEARQEIRTKNALLDARHLTGSKSLFHNFQTQFRKFILQDEPENYIRARLKDLDERHEKYGGSPFLQEPDIKNGVGGLRDYQNILWMAQIKLNTKNLSGLEKRKYLLREESRQLREAYTFLLRVRNELHFRSQRPTDMLSLESQPLVAEALGYRQKNVLRRVEAFMRDYYGHTWNVFRILERVSLRLRRNLLPGSEPISFRNVINGYRRQTHQEIDGLYRRDELLYPISTSIFEEDPARIIRVFRHAQQLDVSLSLELSDLVEASINLITPRVCSNASANRAFRSILQTVGSVYPTLWEMHKLGVLGRFLPEFGRLACRVQHEHYHRYTADIHTLNTIKCLDAVLLRKDPATIRYHDALRQTEAPSLLYTILLLHDIGKAEGVRGHAERGTETARPMLERMEVKSELMGKILFIIQHHLEMARFWQRYDIDDPRTIDRFAETIQNTDQLHYLYVHTFCDTCGTSTNLWNAYKESLHNNLYQRTLDVLVSGKTQTTEYRRQMMGVYQEIQKMQLKDISQEEIDAHFSLLPERYFLHHNAADVELHLRMIHQLLNNIYEASSLGALFPVIDWIDDLEQSMTVVDVVTWDRPGLFYKLAGALSASGVNILSTKAISRSDHITIDTFYVTDPGGGVVSNPKARELFSHYVEQALLHDKDLLPELEAISRNRKKRQRTEPEKLKMPFPAQVDVYHELTLRRTILEVQTSDEIGLLYRIARAIHRSGFDITFARINTERGIAMDTFYIEPLNSDKEVETQNLLKLQETITRIITPDDEQATG